MKSYSSKLAKYAGVVFTTMGQMFRPQAEQVAISPYGLDYSTPGVRQFSPSVRTERKKANRQHRRKMIDKKGWF